LAVLIFLKEKNAVFMALNAIWIGFFAVAFIVGLIQLLFYGDTEIFPAMMNATFEMAKTGFEVSLGLTGVMTLC
jgi:spore maturation protein SpmA